MRQLEDRILKDGKVLPGGVLKVGSFLNHCIDTELLGEMANEIARLYGNSGVSKIITIAGGQNAFGQLQNSEESRRTNVSMTMEEFYATAMDVDYLIYNASGYSAGVNSVDKLLEMSPLLADCKAVREGNVWWIGPETYQHSDKIASLIADIHTMLTAGEGEMTFLHKMG